MTRPAPPTSLEVRWGFEVGGGGDDAEAALMYRYNFFAFAS